MNAERVRRVDRHETRFANFTGSWKEILHTIDQLHSHVLQYVVQRQQDL